VQSALQVGIAFVYHLKLDGSVASVAHIDASIWGLQTNNHQFPNGELVLGRNATQVAGQMDNIVYGFKAHQHGHPVILDGLKVFLPSALHVQDKEHLSAPPDEQVANSGEQETVAARLEEIDKHWP